ncbi:MAG: hypothetical protein IK133_01190, partial [Clostridia bacterium]|nr:hypothetical protein [Clostridia bacterium]
MKRLFAIILTLCLMLGLLPAAEAYSCTAHQWSQWYVEIEPSCTYGGEEFRFCTICGEYEYRFPAALGHSYKKSVVDQATCTEWGLVSYTCSRCGDVYGEEVEPLGHSWQQKTTREPTCTENGQAANVCSRCGQTQQGTIIVVPALGHKWGQWTVDTPSTCVAYGTRYHVCDRCGTKEWERNYADGLG